MLDYWAPPGAALQDTEHMLTVVDDILRHTPEVSGFSRRTGAEMGFFVTETNRGDYAVRLSGPADAASTRSSRTCAARSHARLPGLRVEFIQILQDMIGDLSGNPEPIEIKLFGTDAPVLRPVAEHVERADRADPRRRRLLQRHHAKWDRPIDVDVDARRAALHRTRRRQRCSTGSRRRSPAGRRTGPGKRSRHPPAAAISAALSRPHRCARRTHAGDAAGRLGAAAVAGTPRASAGRPWSATREDLRTLVRVTARLEGRDLGSAMRDVQRALAGKLTLPAGVTAGVRRALRQPAARLRGAAARCSPPRWPASRRCCWSSSAPSRRLSPSSSAAAWRCRAAWRHCG